MRRSLWLAALCLVAGALSQAYVVCYLRGGPRIIDATSYWLEAKSLAEGAFSFVVPEPSASFRGRFLLASGDGRTLGVLFPPGYPLLLSLGMRLGAPLLVGPALAALLVWVTFELARALGQETRVAWLAAGLSAVCAALRYHTADTMSHGLATLLGCLALLFALRPELRFGRLLCGLCLGGLLATRPVSMLVASSLCVLALWSTPARTRTLLAVGLGLLPGLALLLAQQHALTGSWLGSTQLAYYAAADAPPGCFRYGFGEGVGCRFEHGDFVSRYLPHGYGFAAAARNLLVHLAGFSVDATNAVPLTLLAAYAALRHGRGRLGLAALGVGLQALAYVPFYFDGNYPGGGARFLCEAIPLCQILVARAACDLRLGRYAVPIALAGFALHARHDHELLRDREGGRPMFEPEVVAQAGVTRGLVFVDTDHGFNLGFEPGVQRAGLWVARSRQDGHDRELYENLGSPPTYRYRYDLTGRTAPRLEPFVPPATTRREAEAEWPALLRRGSAYPIHYPCASGGRALRLYPGTLLELPLQKLEPGLPASGPAALELGWVTTQAVESELRVTIPGTSPQTLRSRGPGCASWRLAGPSFGERAVLMVELVRGDGGLDFTDHGPGDAQPWFP